MINTILRYAFFGLFVRPAVFLLMGLNIRFRSRLPVDGPAILVANHNSHLDTGVLMSVFPLKTLRKVRPVAAADYFLRNPIISWFSLGIIRIIPVIRGGKKDGKGDYDPLALISEALRNGDIIIFFPEGSRGEPEMRGRFKSGIAILAERHPDVPVVPIFLHGLGKALPKGEALLVPFFCDIYVGQSLKWNGKKEEFVQELERRIEEGASRCQLPAWE